MVSLEKQSQDVILRSLKETSQFLENNSGNQSAKSSGLLLLWSILEASIVSIIPNKNSESRLRTPLGLINDAAIAGVISKKSLEFLERLMQKWNGMAHGVLSETVSRNELDTLISICKEILAQTDA